MRASLLAVLIAACGGATPAPAPPPSAPPPSCDALHVSLDAIGTKDAPFYVYVINDVPSAEADARTAAAKGAIAACHDDRWTPHAIGCFLHAEDEHVEVACVAALPAAQVQSLRAHVDGAVAATKNAVIRRYSPQEWTDVAADTGLPGCDDYLRAFNTFMHCDKLDAKSRAAGAAAIQQMLDGLKTLDDPRAPPDLKKTANDRCTAALHDLHDAAKQLGCPLP